MGNHCIIKYLFLNRLTVFQRTFLAYIFIKIFLDKVILRILVFIGLNKKLTL